MSPQYGELRPTNGWDRLASLGTPANFNGFRISEALPHGTLVVGVSQTLQRWTEGATYIRQGSHHVGQIWSLLALQVRCDALNQVKLDAYRAHHWYTLPCQIYCWLLKGSTWAPNIQNLAKFPFVWPSKETWCSDQDETTENIHCVPTEARPHSNPFRYSTTWQKHISHTSVTIYLTQTTQGSTKYTV